MDARNNSIAIDTQLLSLLIKAFPVGCGVAGESDTTDKPLTILCPPIDGTVNPTYSTHPWGTDCRCRMTRDLWPVTESPPSSSALIIIMSPMDMPTSALAIQESPKEPLQMQMERTKPTPLEKWHW